MHRFFVLASDICDNAVQLSVEVARHIRSLRLRPSERFVVCDGEGFDYICTLGEKADGNAVIVDKLPSCGEPSVRCFVFIAFSKGDRLDFAVQKSVELGAYEIVLFPSARCVSIPADSQKKIARLQKISLETAKQCNRGRVPLVHCADSFGDAVSLACRADLPLFFYELEESNGLKAILEQRASGFLKNPGFSGGILNAGSVCSVNRASSLVAGTVSSVAGTFPSFVGTVSIVTGPEGGFEPYEAEAANSAGLVSVSLGRRILRSETAPIAALAATMFFFGEM